MFSYEFYDPTQEKGDAWQTWFEGAEDGWHLSQDGKTELLRRSKGRCAACDAKLEYPRFAYFRLIDHWPYRLLKHALWNVFPLCGACNQAQLDFDARYEFPATAERAEIGEDDVTDIGRCLGAFEKIMTKNRWCFAPGQPGLKAYLNPESSKFGHLFLTESGSFEVSQKAPEAQKLWNTIARYALNEDFHCKARQDAMGGGYLWDEAERFAWMTPEFLDMSSKAAKQKASRNTAPARPAKHARDETRAGAGDVSFATSSVEAEDVVGGDAQIRRDDPINHSTEHVLRVKHVTLENFRQFKTLEVESAAGDEAPEQAPAMMFLSENGCGKTTLLEGISLALTKEDSLAEAQYLDFPIVHEPLAALAAPSKGGMKEAHVNVMLERFEDGKWGDVGFAQTLVQRRSEGGLQFGFKGGAETDQNYPMILAYGPGRKWKLGDECDKNGGAERHDTAQEACMRNVEHLISRHRNPLLASPRWFFEEELEEATPGFPEVLSILSDLLAVGAPLTAIVPTCVEEGAERKILCLEFDGRPPIPFKAMSSGYQALITLFCDIFIEIYRQVSRAPDGAQAINPREQAAIVLIDEIESNLHPRWKISVVDALRRAFPKVSFIFSSHDPLCVRGMLAGEVFLIGTGLPQQEGLAHFVMQYQEDPNGLTIDQLLESDLFGLLSADGDWNDRRMWKLIKEAKGEGDTRSEEARLKERVRASLRTSFPFLTAHNLNVLEGQIMGMVAAPRGSSADMEAAQ